LLVTLVGPVFPLPGGIAQHNDRLAIEIEKLGHEVLVESWKAQYPKSLYRGTPQLNEKQIEVGQAPAVRRELAWYSPVSWLKAGLRSRKKALVILTVPTPYHFFPYLLFTVGSGKRPRTVGIVHNVRPHERAHFGSILMKSLLALCDSVLIHSDSFRQEIDELGTPKLEVCVVKLPSPWNFSPPQPISSQRMPERLRLLFFGTIRHYKGLDLLLEAMRDVKEVELVVAGEFWEPLAKYQRLAGQFGVSDRVTFEPGYVAAENIPYLFEACDALVLPYRSATSSILPDLAFGFGRPVVATKVGALGESVIDGINGFVVEQHSVTKLSAALERLKDKKLYSQLVEGARAHSDKTGWEHYCSALLGCAGKQQF
jgi:glycosyltransferase involved in cell wall biosynthesis